MHSSGTWSRGGFVVIYFVLAVFPSLRWLSTVFCTAIFEGWEIGYTTWWPSCILLLATDVIVLFLSVCFLVWGFFFFSEHCSVMGLCFCVYSISICFIKSCLNLGVNFLEEVCVLFSCVKHVSWAYQDTDGTSRKPKPTRQKHWFVYHHTSIHTHTQNNLGNQLQGANFFAPKSLEQWRWLNSTVILLRLCLRKFLVLEKLEKESCFRSWEPGWLTMNSFVWTA